MQVRLLVFVGLAVSWAATAASQQPAESPRREYDQTVSRAIRFLETKGQLEDGSFSAVSAPGVTSLVTTALLQHGRTPNSPAVAKALKFLEQFIRDDGGIYQEGTLYRNYETCLAIVCFKEANRDGRYDATLKKADAFRQGPSVGRGPRRQTSPIPPMAAPGTASTSGPTCPTQLSCSMP